MDGRILLMNADLSGNPRSEPFPSQAERIVAAFNVECELWPCDDGDGGCAIDREYC